MSGDTKKRKKKNKDGADNIDEHDMNSYQKNMALQFAKHQNPGHNEHMERNTSGRDSNFWTDIPRFIKGCCGYFLPKSCCRKRNRSKDIGQDYQNQDGHYSSGESDSEFTYPIQSLSTEEKCKRNLYLWNKSYQKSKGAAILIKKFREVRNKIKIYGVLSEKQKLEVDETVVY